MTGKTHAAAGLTVGIGCASLLSLSPAHGVAAAVCAVVGSLFPDIDNHTSTIGRKVKFVSFLLQLFIGHRTVFHAPLLYALLWLFGRKILPQLSLYLTTFSIGVLSHLFLDMLTPAGIPLFWPIRKKVHILAFRTSGFVDWLLCFLFIAVSQYLLFTLLLPYF